MRKLKYTTIFKRDLKRILKRGYCEEKLFKILKLLVNNETLPSFARPHKLVGNYVGLWECHIQPDWLLIYEYSSEGLLILRRTGTHADLFK